MDAAQNETLQIRGWQVMFLARGKRGPFRTRCRVLRGRDDQCGVQVDLIDIGNDERLIAVASASFS